MGCVLGSAENGRVQIVVSWQTYRGRRGLLAGFPPKGRSSNRLERRGPIQHQTTGRRRSFPGKAVALSRGVRCERCGQAEGTKGEYEGWGRSKRPSAVASLGRSALRYTDDHCRSCQ